MKKYFYLAAVSAMMLTACSSDNDVLQPTPEPTTTTPQVAVQQQAVAFDTYVPIIASTRADAWSGKPGVMTTTTLKETETNGGGFGVFGFYTDNANYASGTSKPNFMYNQKVLWDNLSLGWKYEPLKYWPNETTNDSQNPAATANELDKLTFFAYAPYVASSSTNAAAGELNGVTYSSGTPATDQYGIIKITDNSTASDPKVTYRVSKDATKTVDLLWGVAPAGGLNYTSVASGLDNSTSTTTTITTGTVAVPQGLPLIDLIKPNKDQKMKFLFRHALSRLNFTVVGAFDQIAPGGSQDAKTKVLVDNVKVFEETAASIKTDGVLNLNNGTAWEANWETKTGGDYTSSPLFTIANGELTASIKDAGAVAFGSQPTGVTTAETDLFADNTKFFAVIPSASTKFVFEITYYVQTKDDALAVVSGVDGSRIKNVVRVPVTIDLKNNKSYTFRLILGLTSVKLTAEVADWELAGDVDANLPRNNP